jgi:hypothetical protein
VSRCAGEADHCLVPAVEDDAAGVEESPLEGVGGGGAVAGGGERLSRLVITRETVEEVLNGPGAEASLAAVPDEAAPSRSGHLSAVGALAVPPWEAGLEASVLPEAYRDLLEMAAAARMNMAGIGVQLLMVRSMNQAAKYAPGRRLVWRRQVRRAKHVRGTAARTRCLMAV